MLKDIDVFKCLSVRGPKTRTFGPNAWRELSEADRLLRLPFAYWGLHNLDRQPFNREAVFALADCDSVYETTLCLVNGG
jgi:hypothetical protein